VLFLCTGNSCRSQIAEGWAKKLKGEVIEAYSAGTHPQGLNPLAVKVMAEAGVDISAGTSKRPQDLNFPFDYVVTVCDSAHESCPVFPASTRIIHVGFDDPPRLAAAATDESQALVHYRRVRDEIRQFVESLPESLTRQGSLTSDFVTSLDITATKP
jgi:arsenate reductase